MEGLDVFNKMLDVAQEAKRHYIPVISKVRGIPVSMLTPVYVIYNEDCGVWTCCKTRKELAEHIDVELELNFDQGKETPIEIKVRFMTLFEIEEMNKREPPC